MVLEMLQQLDRQDMKHDVAVTEAPILQRMRWKQNGDREDESWLSNDCEQGRRTIAQHRLSESAGASVATYTMPLHQYTGDV